jgi:hypothetical protein
MKQLQEQDEKHRHSILGAAAEGKNSIRTPIHD